MNGGEDGAFEENPDETQRQARGASQPPPRQTDSELHSASLVFLQLSEEAVGRAGDRIPRVERHPRSPPLNPVSCWYPAADAATVDIYRVLITLETRPQLSL